MKYLKIIAILLLATACHKTYYDSYMAYDTMTIHEEPFEDSPSVATVATLRQPSTFRYNEAHPHFYLQKPLTVMEKDDSGSWGFIEVTDVFHRASGWVCLDKMQYAGDNNPKTVTAAYVVKCKKVPLYKHPKTGSSEALPYWLVQGDTVQVWKEGHNGWAHVGNYHTHMSMPYDYRYGWVQTAQLSPIDSFSWSSLKDGRREVYKKEQEEKDKADETGVSNNTRNRLGYGGGAVLAIILALLLNGSAGKRNKRKAMWTELGMSAAVLALAAITYGAYWPLLGFLHSIIDGVAAACLAFVVLYPLLYIRLTARIWKYAFIVIGIMLVLGSSASMHNVILLLLIDVALAYAIVRLARRIHFDVCTKCGYYGNHEYNGTDREEKETVREDWEETSSSGHKTSYSIFKGYVRWTTYRTCMRCGQQFKNVELVKTERRVNR